jgi:hypothetical protein
MFELLRLVPDQLLELVGQVAAALPVACCCNHPGCSSLAGPSEQQLVAGKGCVCARCKTARWGLTRHNMCTGSKGVLLWLFACTWIHRVSPSLYVLATAMHYTEWNVKFVLNSSTLGCICYAVVTWLGCRSCRTLRVAATQHASRAVMLPLGCITQVLLQGLPGGALAAAQACLQATQGSSGGGSSSSIQLMSVQPLPYGATCSCRTAAYRCFSWCWCCTGMVSQGCTHYGQQ